MRCVLVPQPDWNYFQIQLIRGTDLLEVQAVKTLEAAYPSARRWQVESRAPFCSLAAAA